MTMVTVHTEALDVRGRIDAGLFAGKKPAQIATEVFDTDDDAACPAVVHWIARQFTLEIHRRQGYLRRRLAHKQAA